MELIISQGAHGLMTAVWHWQNWIVSEMVGTIDYTDMMERFSRWCMHGDIHHLAEVFDIGIATSRALMNYAKGIAPLESGGKTEWDNGKWFSYAYSSSLPVFVQAWQKKSLYFRK